ncbi:unnamed protein product [Effrenium voratum]|nr:unnamed protein product [Effrenium voratum]
MESRLRQPGWTRDRERDSSLPPIGSERSRFERAPRSQSRGRRDESRGYRDSSLPPLSDGRGASVSASRGGSVSAPRGIARSSSRRLEESPNQPPRRPPRAGAGPKTPPAHSAPHSAPSRERTAARDATPPRARATRAPPTRTDSPPIRASGGYRMPEAAARPASPPIRAAGSYAAPEVSRASRPSAASGAASSRPFDAVEAVRPSPPRGKAPSKKVHPRPQAPPSPPQRSSETQARPSSPPIRASGAYAPTEAPEARPSSPPIRASGAYAQTEAPEDGLRPRPASPPIRAAGGYGGHGGYGEAPRPDAIGAGFQEPPGVVEESLLIPCAHCGRKFAEKAHERHIAVCKKVFVEKRKAFDVVQHRLAEGATPIKEKEKEREKVKDDKMPDWKKKSEAFRAAMKDARLVSQYQKEGRPLSELPAAKATDPELDDRKPCPFCGRKFGEQQAQRHIPFCEKQHMKGQVKAKAWLLSLAGRARGRVPEPSS